MVGDEREKERKKMVEQVTKRKRERKEMQMV